MDNKSGPRPQSWPGNGSGSEDSCEVMREVAESVELLLSGCITLSNVINSVSVSAQDGIVALRKAHMRSSSSFSRLPKVALEKGAMLVWLNTDRSRPRRAQCRPLPISLHSSFLQAISAVMRWLFHVQKVPAASEHLGLANLQARCDTCCA